MLATHGPHWFDRRPPDSPWQSIGISIAVTAAIFAASFASMTSVSLWTDRASSVSPPVMVPLEPPIPRPAPRPRPTTRVAPPKPAAPTTVPTEIAPVSTIPVAPPAVAPIAVPPAPVARADTTTARSEAAKIPMGIIAPPLKFGDADAVATRAGAHVDRAGVTYDSRAANTVAVRDSVIRAKMPSIPDLLLTHPMKGRELAELQESRHAADRLARRATTAGNAADVHVMMGEGLGGAGAVGGGKTVSTDGRSVTVSVPFPLFSPGPSPAERKRNEAIDADNQLRLRRMGDRVLAQQDSIRADSLRRDSLARKRVIPEP